MRRKWRKPKPKPDYKKHNINEKITHPEVYLIDETGANTGAMPTEEALKMAKDLEMDLVEVNPKADPPVVKIMDFGQYKYEQDKKAHKQKMQQKKVDTKEVRLTFRISDHDFNFRLEQGKKFLQKGNKLKIELILKGREKQHQQKARELILGFVDKIEQNEEFNIAREQDLTKQGGKFIIILTNKTN